MLPTLPSIADAQTLMRQGKLRPIDLVEHCLGRIHQFDDQIHAWVMVDEEGARNEAHRLGKMLDDGQEPVGPLHGIPIGIKDIIDVAGWPTLCGSKLRAGHVAGKDAFVVEHLRKAGAIILGKTVTTEWASFDPPPTRNPWNLNHTPGGSSSGSAAAVAMEMCVAALGTQTGGSIVRPASYCGVVGFKPNFGWLSLSGIYPFSLHLDHVGPIARSVGDAAELYPIMEGSCFDSSTYLATENGEHEVRIQWLEGGLIAEADTETESHFADLRSRLGNLCVLESLPIPNYLEPARVVHRRIMAVEGAEVHREPFERNPASFGERIRGLISEGRQANALDYANSLRLQDEIKNRLSNNCNWKDGKIVWAMPSTPTAAPGLDTTGDPIFNSLWSLSGLPTITIPCGFTSIGLPLGLQLIGGFDRDVFKAASLCERLLSQCQKPPLLLEIQ